MRSFFFCFASSRATSQTEVPAKPQTAKHSTATAPQAAALSDALPDPRDCFTRACRRTFHKTEGIAGLRLQLLRLATTARLMQVVAHPDDEDGGMLTLEARGHGVNTLLMTLNRGEGGQNKIGSNLSDVLGVLRAEELLASDQYYGVQDRFSRVADFGFSKNGRRNFCQVGRARCRPGGYGARDSHVPSGCAGGTIFGNGTRWARESSSVEHSDERGVPRGGGSEAISRAVRTGIASVAGKETVYRKCMRIRGDDVS